MANRVNARSSKSLSRAALFFIRFPKHLTLGHPSIIIYMDKVISSLLYSSLLAKDLLPGAFTLNRLHACGWYVCETFILFELSTSVTSSSGVGPTQIICPLRSGSIHPLVQWTAGTTTTSKKERLLWRTQIRSPRHHKKFQSCEVDFLDLLEAIIAAVDN